MPNPIPAAGEAMPKAKPTVEQVAAAMRGLEVRVIELTHMVRIANDIVEKLFNLPSSTKGTTLVFHVEHNERETFMFSLSNVERRAKDLKDAYFAAWDGEEVE